MKLVLREDVSSLGKKGDVVNVSRGYARNYLFPKNLAIDATEQNLEQELLSKFPGLKDLTAEDNAALDAILSPTVKQALGKVIPELEPIFSQFGTNEPNVIMPVSIVSNYAMRKYGGNQNEALAAFVDDVSGQMEQQTNVPPSQGLMTSPQTT